MPKRKVPPELRTLPGDDKPSNRPACLRFEATVRRLNPKSLGFTIPAAIIKSWGIKQGDPVSLLVEEDHVALLIFKKPEMKGGEKVR